MMSAFPIIRKALLFVITLILLSPNTWSQDNFHWIHLGGPPGGLGYDIRYNPDFPNIWYVTDANAGVHRSVDNGIRWESVNQGIETYAGPTNDLIPVFCLTVNPHDPTIIWSGTTGNGHLYKSEDAGVTWVEKDEGIVKEYDILSFRGVTFDPVSPDIMYAMGEINDESLGGPGVWGLGTGGVIFKSVNAGEHWEKIWDGGIPSSLTRYMWINPENTDILYVSTGIFDRGAVGEGDFFNEPFGGIGILKSEDGGDSWTIQDEKNGLRCLYLGSLYMHPLHPDTLLTCAAHVLTDGRGLQYLENIVGSGGTTPFGVYRTTDGGEHWTQVLAEGTGEVFASVEYSTLNPDIAYAASAEAIYRSEDAGETWNRVSLREGNWGPPGIVTGFPIDIQCDPRNSDRLFINNYGGGNYLSEDGGKTWVNASNGCTGSRPRKVVVSPQDAALIYTVAPSGIWYSDNAGYTWNGIHFPPENAPVLADYSSVLADKTLKHHIYAGTRASHILESFDGGLSWEFLWPGFDSQDEIITYDVEISDLVNAPSDPDFMYAGLSIPGCSYTTDPCGKGMGVVFSYDGGDSWTISENSLIKELAVISLAVDPGDAYKVYAGTETGLFVSDDGAVSWTEIATLPVDGRSRAVALNPNMAEQIFVGIDGYGLYISDDGGLSWSPSVAGLQANSSLRKILFDPTDNRVIYTCDLLSGVYRSVDGGGSWTIMNDSLFNRGVTDLSISLDGQHLYASTYGSGVYRMDLNGEPPLIQTSVWQGYRQTNMEVEFFPNPTSDISHLKINDDFDGLELYNFLGTRVFSCTGCSQIDLAPLPPGCYLAIVKLGPDKQDIKKIIIRK
jgi:photosystem II stability/assembly factor-like uncharacterized protein